METIMKPDHYQAMKNQQGSALIISLIILIAMTLIGVTAMRTTAMEEKMTSNMRDKEIAFQAAEAALIDGELLMAGLVTNSSFDGSAGRLGSSDADPDYFAGATWGSSSSIQYSDTFDGVEEQPRFILKFLGETEGDTGSLKTGGYGQRRSSTVSNFKVTARGTGRVGDNTQVILQSHYGKIM